MTFTTLPVQVAGPSYLSRSRALSSQTTSNFYQEVDEGGKSPISLNSFPGQTDFGELPSIETLPASELLDRGITVMNRIVYKVCGTRFYEVAEDGTHTQRGEVLRGNGRCTFANDGVNLFIVNQGFVQHYENVTNTLTDVTDPDIVGSIAVDFLNNQFIYTKPNLFIISDVGDGTQASGLNAAQAETQPDDLVRAYVFDQTAYMFGENTTEPWYNTGTGSPPFTRIDTEITSTGLGALHAIDNTDNFLYWLGDDRQIYQLSSNGHKRVSSIAIANAIEGYDDVSDAVAWAMTFQGQNFIVFSFPTANKTWVINETLGVNGWFEISGDNNNGKYNATSFTRAYNKNLISDEDNGHVYELDIDSFSNFEADMRRVRVMSSIDGEILGQRGKRVQMSRFELIIEAGVGLISGQGEDPKIMIEASYDGGKSFDPGVWMRIGRLGETDIRAEWWALVSFYDLILRISTSDPVQYTIMSGSIDLRLAGR